MEDRRAFLKSLTAGGAILGLPQINEVKELRYSEKDVVVLKVSGCIKSELVEKITQEFHANMPGIKVLILSEGIDIEVLRGIA
jgi:hypothetical protein